MSTGVLVDWLSFTVPIDGLQSIPSALWLGKCLATVRRATTGLVPLFATASDFTEFSGRAPYAIRWTCADFGTTLLAHPGIGHVLCEVSGKGCQALRDADRFDDALLSVVSHLTRLDLAVDLDTQADPRAFVKEHDTTRFTTQSTFTSRTGITCYIGSTKSERYARVYRYKEPLPRAKTLRCEHVFRATWARKVGALIIGRGLAAAAQYCGQVWAWTHAAWDIPESDELITISRELATRHPNQVLWLLTQVFPCMRKMATEGIIDDLRGFVEEHLLGPHEEEEPSPNVCERD